jgi:predicted ATPase/class 3 adenylate cyclase
MEREAGARPTERQHNLPADPTPFIGRRAELAEVSGLLTGTRLLTLIGIGGCGKTRLGVAAAADALPSFSDGVWLVELAPLSAVAPLAAAVVASLGLDIGTPLSAGAAQERLIDHLADRRMLLVLDNCEHLVAACAALVNVLLRRCPQLVVLTTSREVLGLPGEVVWAVPPLTLPTEATAEPCDLEGSDAAALFCSRARAAQPALTLDPAGTAAVARICRRLDGIPLALELAAARTRALTVDEIADRLDDRFNLLKGASRLALPQHQTLRAAMDWSYDLLGPEERVALRRIAVFPGTFDLGAAEAVITTPFSGGPDRETGGSDAVELLLRLVDKSLVSTVAAGPSMRYRLLETVRSYAGEHLAAAQEVDVVRRRHRDHFASLARRWLSRPGDPFWADNEWPVRMAADEDNLREAVTGALADGQAEIALDLLAIQWMFWLFSSRPEAQAWLEEAVAATERLAVRARVFVLIGLGYTLSFGEQLDRARGVRLLADARALAGDLGDDVAIAASDYANAEVALGRGDLAGARESATSAIGRWEAARAPGGVAYCERVLGWVALAEGDVPGAWRRFESSLEHGWHSDLSTAHAAAALAPLVARTGDRPRAGALATEALTRARRLPLRLVEAMALVQATKARILAGDAVGAGGHAADLVALLARTGAQAWAADAIDLTALVLAATGREASAARLAGACDALRETRNESGLPDLVTERATSRARVRETLGRVAWDAELAAGRAMSGAAALTYAGSVLATPAELPAESPTADDPGSAGLSQSSARRSEDRSAERVLATVLFTDIVDSTMRAAVVGDTEWRRVVEVHNRLFRRHLAAHCGREIKTTGDGFLATFDGPATAVRCARAFAIDVRDLGISVRTGIHTGEVDVTVEDISGLAVAIAARVCALAGPDQVLTTATVRDLTAGSQLAFEPRGDYALKGVPGTWAVLEAFDRPTTAPTSSPTALLRRQGDLWEIGHNEQRVHLRHAKGLADLAALVARPGVDVHVLDLASPDARVARAECRGGPVLDRTALAAYRQRLADLEDEEAEAAAHNDQGRLALLELERASLLTELRQATGAGGRVRPLGSDATERARKAVAGRLREAVRRIETVLPELGSHLERSLVTGTSCRYQPREPFTWTVRDE